MASSIVESLQSGTGEVQQVQHEEEMLHEVQLQSEVETETEVDADAIAEVVIEEGKKKGIRLFGTNGRAARFYRSVRARIGKSKKEAMKEAEDTVVEEKTGDTVEEEKKDTVETIAEEKEEDTVEKTEEKKEEAKVTRRGTFYASMRAKFAKKAADKKAKEDTVVTYTVGEDDTVAVENKDTVEGTVEEEKTEDAAPEAIQEGEKKAWTARFSQRVRGVFKKKDTVEEEKKDTVDEKNKDTVEEEKKDTVEDDKKVTVETIAEEKE